jgi:hypothetical protein
VQRIAALTSKACAITQSIVSLVGRVKSLLWLVVASSLTVLYQARTIRVLQVVLSDLPISTVSTNTIIVRFSDRTSTRYFIPAAV